MSSFANFYRDSQSLHPISVSSLGDDPVLELLLDSHRSEIFGTDRGSFWIAFNSAQEGFHVSLQDSLMVNVGQRTVVSVRYLSFFKLQTLYNKFITVLKSSQSRKMPNDLTPRRDAAGSQKRQSKCMVVTFSRITLRTCVSTTACFRLPSPFLVARLGTMLNQR